MILKDRAYEITINPNYNGYQRGLASIVYKFFDKNKGSGANVDELLAQELHKSVIDKFKRRKVYTRYNDWNADLAEMGSLSSFNRDVKYLLYVIYVFTKCSWVKPLKGKKIKQSFIVLLKL